MNMRCKCSRNLVKTHYLRLSFAIFKSIVV